MNQRRNIIILLLLAVVAGGVIYYQVFRETPEQRAWQEKYQEGQTGPSAGGPAAPATGPAAPSASATTGPSASQFKRADVDIDALIAGIKEVGFDYDTVALDVDPMIPLVGPFAPQRVAAGQGREQMPLQNRQDIQAVIRNLRVTGIMWDKYDPMAVITFPVRGQKSAEVVARGFALPETGVTVHDIERERVILNINDVLVPIELEER